MGVDLDWQIRDYEPDDPEKDRYNERVRVSSGGPRRLWSRGVIGWVTSIVVFALAAAGLWYAQDRGQRALADELRSVVLLETQALARGDRQLFLNFQDPTDAGWKTDQVDRFTAFPRQGDVQAATVLKLGVEGDWAWVDVRQSLPEKDNFMQVQPPRLAEVVQTWFYRRINHTWVHMAPQKVAPRYWGNTVEQQIGHWRIMYPESDRTLVAPWIKRLQRYGDNVCQDVGCSADFAQTLIFSQTVTAIPELGRFSRSNDGAIVLPSLRVMGWRTDQAIDPALTFTLGQHFTYSVMNQTIGYGIGRWHVGPQSIIAQSVTFWELQQATYTLGPDTMKADWQELRKQVLAPLNGQSQLKLSDLWASRSQLAVAELFSLAEYVAQDYGRDRLGAWLRAAGDSNSLADSITASLPVASADKFEAGWMAYLSKIQYQ